MPATAPALGRFPLPASRGLPPARFRCRAPGTGFAPGRSGGRFALGTRAGPAAAAVLSAVGAPSAGRRPGQGRPRSIRDTLRPARRCPSKPGE